MLFLLRHIGETPVESVLAGGRGDGGIKVATRTTAALVLPLGVCLLAAAAAVAADGLRTALDFKFCDFLFYIRSFYIRHLVFGHNFNSAFLQNFKLCVVFLYSVPLKLCACVCIISSTIRPLIMLFYTNIFYKHGRCLTFYTLSL